MLTFAKSHPFIFGVSLAAFKTCAVDAIVQKYVEKKEKFDYSRNLVFLKFGGVSHIIL